MSVIFAAMTACVCAEEVSVAKKTEKPAAPELPAFAAEPTAWVTTMTEAAKLAGATKKPVLVHFYSTSCGPCAVMERDVFSDPEVLRICGEYYIMVKINLTEDKAAAGRYGIQGVPTDVILTHEGNLVAKSMGGKTKEKFNTFYRSVAQQMDYRPAGAAETDTFRLANSVEPPAAPQKPATVQPDILPLKPTGVQMAATKPAAQIMLDGYCCVTLVEHGKWLKGDLKFGVSHRGQIYLFGSQDFAGRFFENPDFYAVAAGGYDVVQLLDANQYVPGTREYGLRYDNVNFVFASETSREAFRKDPEKYMTPVRVELLRTAQAGKGETTH